MSEADRDRADRPVDEDEGFLQRWTRRKDAARRGVEPEAAAADQADQSAPESDLANADRAAVSATAADQEAEPEPPGDEDMPPLDSIDQGGSVAAFFSPKVSAGLRRAALRRLFSQPEFGAVDMLDDYAKDYTNRAPLGDIVTADMRYRAEQAAKRLARKLSESLQDGEGEDTRVALGDAQVQANLDATGPAEAEAEADVAGAASDQVTAPDERTARAPDTNDTDNDDDQRPA